MKKLILYLFLLASLNSLNAQTLLTDDFSYTSGTNLGGQGGWVISGAASPNHIVVGNGSLTYNTYIGSNIGNHVSLNNIDPGEIVLKDFAAQTSGTLYCSFLVRVISLGATATNGFVCGFDQSGGATNLNAMLYIKKIAASTFQFGFSPKPGGGVSYVLTDNNVNSTFLIVLKYEFVAGAGNDIASLFVINTTVPPTEPSPTTSSTSGTDLPDIGQIFLNSDYIGSLTGSTIMIDGFRVGTSWQTTLLVGVEQTSSQVPSAFRLGQNYPNPFNPETNIRYQIANDKFVLLSVSDAAGKHIVDLVNQKQTAGEYRVNFSGNDLCSGIYFYSLFADGGLVDTKKMILIK